MEFVTFELRPRLRSLNAYVSLKNNIDTDGIVIKLQLHAIKIKIGQHFYTLCMPSVKFLPSSLSALKITKHWITFRIQTHPNLLFGTFSAELINLNKKVKDVTIFYENNVGLPLKNIYCKLICNCCKNQITEYINFKRILPLPSLDCDPQEWYCCNHGTINNISLDPEESDFLYYFHRCVLNKQVFKKDLKIKNSLVHCSRCLTIIGLHKNIKSLELWNCCIEYYISDGEQVVKESGSYLSDFLATVKNTSDSIIGEHILLEARDVNSIHFLLLRLMEFKLNLFVQDTSYSEQETFSLKSLSVIKVLYKFGESNKTLRSNKSDLKYCELAVSSIMAGINELVSSSTRFPPAYRKADDFYIGYLPI